MTLAEISSTCWTRVSFRKVVIIWRWTFSTVRKICWETFSFRENEDERRALDEIRRVQAGWAPLMASRSGEGEFLRDTGKDRPFAAAL